LERQGCQRPPAGFCKISSALCNRSLPAPARKKEEKKKKKKKKTFALDIAPARHSTRFEYAAIPAHWSKKKKGPTARVALSPGNKQAVGKLGGSPRLQPPAEIEGFAGAIPQGAHELLRFHQGTARRVSADKIAVVTGGNVVKDRWGGVVVIGRPAWCLATDKRKVPNEMPGLHRAC